MSFLVLAAASGADDESQLCLTGHLGHDLVLNLSQLRPFGCVLTLKLQDLVFRAEKDVQLGRSAHDANHKVVATLVGRKSCCEACTRGLYQRQHLCWSEQCTHLISHRLVECPK